MRLQLSALALIWLAVAAPAAAQQASPVNDDLFTAFDLEAGAIVTDGIPATHGAGSDLGATCTMSFAGGKVTVARKVGSPACDAIFDAPAPGPLWLDFKVTPAAPAAPYETSQGMKFDRGAGGFVTATFDVATGRIELSSLAIAGHIAYHSAVTGKWRKAAVTGGIATMLQSGDDLTERSRLYLNVNGTILEVEWKRPTTVVAPVVADTTCDRARARAAQYDWTVFVDSRATTGALDIVHYPARLAPSADPFAANYTPPPIGGAVIEPNSFGLIVVRHAPNYTVAFESGSLALSMPGFFTGQGQASGAGGREEGGPREAPVAAQVCTTHQVGPHAPGAFQVKLATSAPTATGGSTKVSERLVDLVVIRRYLGAFRTGIAAIGLAPDQSFDARMAPGSPTAEIVRTKSTPVELVFGYSVYLASLRGERRGRSYFTLGGSARQDSRVGIFLGFGAVSYSSNLDYLKSLHLGLEYEIGPHVALALTGVYRRVTELAPGVEVGAPTGPTVPTRERYVPGVGLILNISPSFFKFPASNPS